MQKYGSWARNPEVDNQRQPIGAEADTIQEKLCWLRLGKDHHAPPPPSDHE